MNESSITNFCIKMLSDENVKREVKYIYTCSEHVNSTYYAIYLYCFNSHLN